LIPAHPARRNWYKPLGDDVIVSLDRRLAQAIAADA
jgi:hypothetical protein